MREQIVARLLEIEEREQVTIFHAVESGSRAWGFASPDSDYDVRFLYVRPAPWYMRLEKTRDVLEYPVGKVWDVNGWDLQKALRLLHNSNPTLLEWLDSPVVYRTAPLAAELRAAGIACYRRRAGLHHYWNMAANNARAYLGEETVQAKKYFYVLRPLLACRWILEQGTPPPVPFDILCSHQLPLVLGPAVAELLDIKQSLPESGRIAHVPELDGYLSESLKELRERIDRLPREADPDWAPLNALFLEAVGQIPV